MKKSSPNHPTTKRLLLSCGLLGIASLLPAEQAPKIVLPDVVETRTVELTQKVRIADVPSGSRELRLWVPVPSDRTWQRVLDISVDQAPGTWEIVSQPGGRGEFLYVEVKDPKAGAVEVAVTCVVERRGVSFPLADAGALPEIQPALFQESLDLEAPLMMADDNIRKLAADACGNENDIGRQAVLLVRKVAELADHYSKDPSKPHCGRGSAQDCLVNGGGCCTDLHSLFIAMARSRGIATRMQYGYRLLDAKEGEAFDPGYRCWVEYFVRGGLGADGYRSGRQRGRRPSSPVVFPQSLPNLALGGAEF